MWRPYLFVNMSSFYCVSVSNMVYISSLGYLARSRTAKWLTVNIPVSQERESLVGLIPGTLHSLNICKILRHPSLERKKCKWYLSLGNPDPGTINTTPFMKLNFTSENPITSKVPPSHQWLSITWEVPHYVRGPPSHQRPHILKFYLHTRNPPSPQSPQSHSPPLRALQSHRPPIRVIFGGANGQLAYTNANHNVDLGQTGFWACCTRGEPKLQLRETLD